MTERIIATTKHRCCDCGLWKDESQFRARKDRPKGISSYCRSCLRERWRRWAYARKAA